MGSSLFATSIPTTSTTSVGGTTRGAAATAASSSSTTKGATQREKVAPAPRETKKRAAKCALLSQSVTVRGTRLKSLP